MGQQRVNALLRSIEADCRDTSRYTGIQAFKPEVMKAIARVPREEFVPDHLKPWAYENNPLPIGNGQTISQPFIVALMTDLLCPNKDDIILEVGTGSGYQAAVLSQLVNKESEKNRGKHNRSIVFSALSREKIDGRAVMPAPNMLPSHQV